MSEASAPSTRSRSTHWAKAGRSPSSARGPAEGLEHRDARSVVRVEDAERLGRGAAVGRGVPQAFLVGEQPHRLLGVVEPGPIDLVDLVPQDVGVARPLVRVPAERGDPALELVLVPAARLDGPRVDPPEGVERAALRGRREERLLVVLAVDVDQARRQLDQAGHRGHVPVDEGA